MQEPNQFPRERNTPIFDHYEDFSKEIKDERLGEIIPMRPVFFNQNGFQHIPTHETPFPRIFRMEKCIKDIDDFISLVEQAELRLQIDHHNIVPMLDFCYSPSNENQTEFFFAGFFEMNDTDLEREINFRGIRNKDFTDLEIFNLIKETVNGMVYLQKNNLIHGDIR